MTFEQFWIERYYHYPAHDFFNYKQGKNDISMHLPVLEYFAALYTGKNIVEFGTRDCFSTSALLRAAIACGGQLFSYDIERSVAINVLEDICKNENLPWVFRQEDTSKCDIPECAVLFVDTLHTDEHIRKELDKRITDKVSNLFIFHDTYTCGLHDYSGPNPNVTGIMPAILDFKHREDLQCVYATEHNNGLVILSR